MIAMSLRELAAAVGGELHGPDGPDIPDVMVSGPAFLDSRAVEPGGLFVAFAGERTDGHDYAEQAVAAGAAGVLGSRPTPVPTVVVDDVQQALGELARVVLARLRAEGDLSVLAITGSQGKTSTKDLLARVLADSAETVATAGSFNNELGLPLTVLRATTTTRFLVLEMGARGIGHLAELTAIAPPDISLVLNVGTAHLGEFGSRENIALAKGELVEALGEDGIAVLNTDDPRVEAMRERTVARVLGFGTTAAAGVRLTDLRTDDLDRPSFRLTAGDQHAEVTLRLLGRHHALNAAAAAAGALAAGLDLAGVAESLSGVESLSRWRMQLLHRDDGLVVINDAYNANPESMAAALETLAGIGRRTGSRTVAVLGEMRELGESSAEAHRTLGRLVADLGITRLLVVGAEDSPAADIVQGAAEADRTWDAPRRASDVHEAAAWLRQTVRAPDVVLVKASRGARLERVADELLRRHDR